MKRASFVGVVVGLFGSAAFGLAQAPTGTPTAAVPAAAAPEAPSAAEAARRATVYARFGDVTITVGDIEDQIAAQTTFRADRYADPARVRELADQMLELALFAAEAERRGHGERRKVRRGYEEVLVQQFIRGEFDERYRLADVADEDVAAYYEANRDEFVLPEQVRASHILVATEEEARALIEQARGMDLRGRRQLAREHSLDTESKLSGGDLRMFARTGLPAAAETGTPVHPAIVEAAFSLDERGEVYPRPVPVEERFSVVMLTLKRPGVTRSLEDAGPGIRRRLNQERRREAIDALVADLNARVQPQKHPERLAPIAIAPPSSAAGLPPHPEQARGHGHGHEHGHGHSH
jgi:peptidyl-prolyl cis-trans isomerase C